MSPRQLVPAGVVLLALALIAGVAQLARPAPVGPGSAGTSARQVAVTSAVRACPPVQGGGPGHVAFIAGAAAAPSSGPASGSGQAELAPLPLAGASLRVASPISQADPDALRMLTVPAAQDASKKDAQVLQGWSVTASGSMAQAMEAEEADGSGLATVRCGEPGSDIWFVGPGQLNGAAQIQLDLMNVDALAASVDVSVITDAGRAQVGDDTGITVPPHETVTESLSSAAGGSSVAAVEVRTSIGRVAADVSESSPSGGTASWLPSTTAPSSRLVIPGVPPSGHAAGLYIAVPGSSNAQVSVLAITSQGAFRPFGTPTIDLPGDSASYAALTPLGGTASALELTANVPIAAAVLVPGNGLGTFTAATAPIGEQAVVAGNTGPGATIVLSAPAAAARVRLTEIAATPAAGTGAAGTGAAGTGAAGTGAGGTGAAGTGAIGSQVVSVPAGHTLAVPAAAPRGAKRGSAFAIVITPLAGSGPLYAARVQTQGQGTVISIIPAVSALATISLPPVRNSYDAISP
jgi:Family of unknown function (DUF5719)